MLHDLLQRRLTYENDGKTGNRIFDCHADDFTGPCG